MRISAAVILLIAAAASPSRATHSGDPLADEIGRWQAYVRGNSSTDENWLQIKVGSEAALAKADEALRAGRRLLALQRLASARVHLAAFSYTAEHPGAARDQRSLEAEWNRMGKTLQPDLGPLTAGSLSSVSPLAVRALAETTLPQVREFYDASLEYGRNTMPSSGVFYLGSAQAQREFVAFCRSLPRPPSQALPPLRPLSDELAGLERDLLAAYRPPAAIERHSDFIGASSVLKEARELDAAGLRAGAMLRYLQAAQRVAALRSAAIPGSDAAGVERTVASFDERTRSGGVDHSIARLFVEAARADLANPAAPVPAGAPSAASLIAADVLPRYFAALEPARPREVTTAPVVTVTLVRWPYT
jgi:hypothetical protein